jgi:hypothetical protein
MLPALGPGNVGDAKFWEKRFEELREKVKNKRALN